MSTAFSNPNRKLVEEMVYPPRLQIDIDTFMKCVNILPSKVVDDISLSLQVNTNQFIHIIVATFKFYNNLFIF